MFLGKKSAHEDFRHCKKLISVNIFKTVVMDTSLLPSTLCTLLFTRFCNFFCIMSKKETKVICNRIELI